MSQDEETPGARTGGAVTALGAAMPLAGYLIGLGAFFMAARTSALTMISECGAFGYLAFAATLLASLATCVVVGLASRGAFRLGALVAAAPLVPFVVSSIGLRSSASMVANVMTAVSYNDVTLIRLAGSKELMSIRIVGACLVLGTALGSALALVLLHRGRAQARGERDDALLAGAVLFLVSVLAAISAADALALRAAFEASNGVETALPSLARALPRARALDMAELATLACALVLGLAAVARSLRAQGAAVVGSALAVCLAIGLGGRALASAAARALEVRTPARSLPDFRPVAFPQYEAGDATDFDCVAALDGVRCGDAAPARYDVTTLVPLFRTKLAAARANAEEPMDPPSEISARTELAREVRPCAVSFETDARLRAPDLRILLEAVAAARCDAISVRGAVVPSALASTGIPAWLAAQLPLHSTIVVLLSVQGDYSPGTVDSVRDSDTAQTLFSRIAGGLDRAEVRFALLTPRPLPRPSPAPAEPAPATDATADSGVGTLGLGSGTSVPGQLGAFNRLGDMLEAAPDAPAVPAGGTPLDAATVQRVMRAHQRDVRQCYEEALRTQPDLGGRVMVTMTISPRGRVTRTESSGTLPPGVTTCIERALRAIEFPPNNRDESITVHYPFIFSAPQ